MNWEEGEVRTITIPATAGNAAYTATPGTGKKWKFLYGRVIAVTDATIANRYIDVQIRTAGAAILTRLFYSAAITASQTKNVSYLPSEYNAAGTGSDLSHIPLGGNFIVNGTDVFRIALDAGVVGDSYSGVFKVIELPN